MPQAQPPQAQVCLPGELGLPGAPEVAMDLGYHAPLTLAIVKTLTFALFKTLSTLQPILIALPRILETLSTILEAFPNILSPLAIVI